MRIISFSEIRHLVVLEPRKGAETTFEQPEINCPNRDNLYKSQIINFNEMLNIYITNSKVYLNE